MTEITFQLAPLEKMLTSNLGMLVGLLQNFEDFASLTLEVILLPFDLPRRMYSFIGPLFSLLYIYNSKLLNYNF